MKKSIYILLIVLCNVSCKGQFNSNEAKNMQNSTMNTFDFNEYNERLANDKTGRGVEFTDEDGNKVIMENSQIPIIMKYPPHPSFYKRVYAYHPDGSLNYEGTLFGDYVAIGKWNFYDNNGNHTQTINEDEKFQEIKPENVLNFLDKKGYINLNNGDGRFREEYDPGFIVEYKIADDENENNYWIITIVLAEKLSEKEIEDIIKSGGGDPPLFKDIVYKMDGKTGKVTRL